MPTFDHLNNYVRGWLIGDFTPAVVRTPQFEVCITEHARGETSTPHYHKRTTEYNVVASGEVEVNDQVCRKGDIFTYHANEVAQVRFLQATTLVVIRIPSDPTDKYSL
jgi:quercetin dioxygenase-like cupin family protein